MGALEANTTLIYGIHLRESANDGSDFSNGASDYRVLFLGEDGQLHVKDSAGTVTDIGSAAGTAPTGARHVRTAGDYTTSSTTFADVDGTNFSLTITTLARRVTIGFVGSGYVNNSAGSLFLDVTVDGTRQGGDFGLTAINQHATASEAYNLSFTYLSAVLTAASHTFKLQYRVGNGAHTGTIQGTGTAGVACEFWVAETMITA